MYELADFLVNLYEKGLEYRTISGYRSMFSAVLPRIDNFRVGQHPDIIRILKGVFNLRPPKKRLVPEWDLRVVLNALRTLPFEPMRKVPLKFITWKTVFLIAITTFRRCSDIQSLRIGEGAVKIQTSGITFLRQGLSKQDRPNHKGANIFIPSFDKDKLLNPKRALAIYLKKTEPFRKTEKDEKLNLFLAVNEPHNPVSVRTISSWIVNTIKQAYNDENKHITAHSTRAVGPSWALFQGVSMKDIMESADWSKETTFTRFYLRKVSEKPHVLGI